MIHIIGIENKQSAFIKDGKWRQMVYIIGVILGASLFSQELSYEYNN